MSFYYRIILAHIMSLFQARAFIIPGRYNYRYHGGADNGYQCPLCKSIFIGTEGLKKLHADHIIPFNKGGKTIWNNLQLLCGKCNRSKYNYLNVGNIL
ncbi:MAG: HNH endonuclease [Desulfobacterales bacterium]|nr:HNH endonuclease [Desulfobacterales bacterium]